jgi:hypothetical protein
MHLWEHHHPYYAASNYGEEHFESWEEMRDNWDATDGQLNLLYRWDWHRPGEDDWEGEEILSIAFVLQRKGRVTVCLCPISAEQEDEVRAWLQARSADLAAVWAPLTPTGTP